MLEKAERLPTVDQLDDPAHQVAFISAHLDNAVEQSGKLAAAGGRENPHGGAGDAPCVEPGIVKAGGPRT